MKTEYFSVIGSSDADNKSPQQSETSSKLLPAERRKRALRNEQLLKRYGDYKELLTLYNPDHMAVFASAPYGGFDQESPMLMELQECWGVNVARSWLKNFVLMLQSYCNIAQLLDERQMKLFIDMFLHGHSYLKMSEVMIFFFKMMHGEYGQFYGAADPMQIFSFLDKFLAERNSRLTMLEDHKAEQERRLRDEREGPYRISGEEWERLKREKPEVCKRLTDKIELFSTAVKNISPEDWRKEFPELFLHC